MVGSFTPDNAEKFGAEPGKHRTIFYGLCVVCAQNCDFDAIEQILSYTLNIKAPGGDRQKDGAGWPQSKTGSRR